MDGGVLPLAFYCRNAQLSLQKAAESRKANLDEEELQHLKAFTTLVTSAIPTHRQFRGWKDIQGIQPVDLHAHIAEAKQRIWELDDAGHLDQPSPTTNGQKHAVVRPTSSRALEPSRSAATKCVSSPRSKVNSPLKFSSEVMLKTSKSVRISEAVPKQRPQRWDIAMTETYGVGKTAKPVSLTQRLKRGAVAPPANSKASPTRAPVGKVDVARPSSAHGVHNPTPGECTSSRPMPRSRDSSRLRGGAGSSMPPTGRGSTALKALTSSTVKVTTLDDECSQPLNSSNRGMRDSSENGANSRGCASTSSSVKSASIPKFANHRASEGPWVKGILRNGSDETAANRNGAMAKSNVEDDEELITWIPVSSRDEKSRVLRRSSDEDGNGEENLELESKQRDHDKGEAPRLHNRAQSLREWKKGYVGGEQRLDESLDVTGAASQELRAHEGSRIRVENRPASAPVQKASARVIKGALPSPTGQRSGVKENCERFRRQMRLLKEKAEDTRMREEEVESMAERFQRQLEEEIDLDGGDIWHNSTQIHEEEEPEDLCDLHRVDQPDLERTSLESLNRTMTRLMNGDYLNPSTLSIESVELARKRMKTVTRGASSSSTSGASAQSSLPLSHYIQKLRESRLKNAAGKGANQHQFEVMKHNSRTEDRDTELLSMTISRTGSTDRQDVSLPASLQGSFTPAIQLPTSSSSSSPKGSHRHSPSLHHGKRLNSHVYHNTIPKSNSSSVSMVRTIPSMGAMVAASYLQDGGSLQDQQALCHPLDETRARALGRSVYETPQQDANDEKIAHLQRVLGELRGSMEGVKIRIEVEGQGWRGRVDCLEKEVESMKEADEDIIEAKHNFKNELKMKLSEFMADTEKLLLREREQVQVLVEERIQKQFKAQHLAEMKDEMHLLWNEMDSLIKSKEDMAGHVERLTFFTKKVQEYSSREQAENGLLRKQLQSLQDDDVQVRSETDKEDVRQAVKKLQNDGNDMKLEIQGLKNIEKTVKVELVDLRTRLGKVQDETEELEREKEMTLVEGARERLLIMERVESLSQLYLGGLEEVRQDLGHVKFGFSERINEIESRWNDFNRNQGTACEDGNTLSLRQVLIDELNQFRSEITEMVDIERGVLKETLEKESTSIWRKVMDAYANNKSEMLNMLKLEIQKQLHSAREKVLIMTDALKCDMDALKTELSHTQNGAEELNQIILAAEEHKDVAAQAAADASSSATKAKEILTDVLVSIGSEVSNTRLESMHLQEKLTTEKNMAIAAASEARLVNEAVLQEKETALAAFQEVRQKSHELQDYLEKESPKLLTAMVVVQKERDRASQAAAEATSSAMKAGELLGEVLGSFNLEMAKARHINMQLQEELEHERGLGTQHSQEVKDRISEELEVAIANWKLAMNEEVVKARETAEGVLGNENIRQPLGFSTPLDLESYIFKTEEKLNNLMATVKQLQDSTSTYRDEKKRLKQHENEQNKKDWTSNTNQLNQVVRTVEERVNETSSEQTELRKRLKRFEGIQTDLIHSVGEVRSNTCTLEKTVNLFLPQYDAAARIVDNLSCKVEHLEEKVEGFSCDEGLAQTISRLAEAKIESLKDLTHSSVGSQDRGKDLRVLQDCVENKDHSHCQAIATVESRVAVVECTLSDIQNGGQSEKEKIGLLTESIDALQRKMAIAEQNGILSDRELVTGTRVIELENRVEHVATATFSNLQLLDNKVERVSTGVQSALEGAALAENKCGALGAELVKVFRMLTATKNSSMAANWPQLSAENCNDDNTRGPRGRSLSPPLRRVATQRLEGRSQSPPPRVNGNTAWNSSRGPPSPLRRSGPPGRPKAGIAREKRTGVRGGRNVDDENHSSELRKAEIRERPDRAKESEAKLESGMTSQGGSPPRDGNWLKSYPRECLPFKDGRFPGHALTVAEQTAPYISVDRRAKNLQKTNIRLESGRIHVNVSHRAGAGTGGQSDKRGDALAVQS